MRVLGIETSCDETGVAVMDAGRGLLGHLLYSQIGTHREFGGVVPELASRDHIRKLTPMVRQVLRDTGTEPGHLGGIAYTGGPGLIGALMVGACLAVSLAYAWDIPVLGVHHMEGHLLAPMLEEDPPEFPFLALLVSGGHTMLVHVAGIGEYRVLGETLDDAVGEAFDKTAKHLGLPYPGGPELARLAETGRADRFRFPRPMLGRPNLDFSFSGLKTAVIVATRDMEMDAQTRADVARAFQDAVVETLVGKTLRALEQADCNRVVVAGGVGANLALRSTLAAAARAAGARVYYPRPEFCTDNGAMIAYAGSLRLAAGQRDESGVVTRARWDMESLPPLAG